MTKIPGIKGRYAHIGWALRQLLPLKYATGYVHKPAHDDCTAQFTTWRMWLGRVFNERVTVLGRVVETVREDGTLSFG